MTTSQRPVRVTQIVFDLNGGGMETLVAEMAKRWSDRSAVEMSIITLSGRDGHVGELVQRMKWVEQFHVLRLTPGLSMIAPLALVQAIRKTRPDVVHLHSGAWYKGALAAKLAGVPRIIYTEHGRHGLQHSDPLIVRWLDRIGSRWTSCVAVVAERLTSYMTDVVGIDRRKIVTVPNGVDMDLFTPGSSDPELRRTLGVAEDALVLGSVGRLVPIKAYSRLVEAFARLRTEDFGRPLVLVIFGDGPDRGEVEAAVARCGVGESVRLPGWTEKATDAYRLLDVFAMTSLSEGMSVSLMEAMACGLCPVVTDVGSNALVLGADLSQQVVPLEEPSKFDAEIRKALSSAEYRRHCGKSARKYAETHHGLERMLRSYLQLYRGESLT